MSDLKASTVEAYTRYLKVLSRGRITVPAGNNILQNLQNRGLARRVRTTDDYLTEWEITEAGRASLNAAPLTPAEVGGLVERLQEAHTCSGCGEYVGSQITDLTEEAATALEAQATELAEIHQRYIDANEARINAEARLAEALKALEASASALEEAREDVEHWGSYAGEYFQDKHDLDGDLDRIARQASAARCALEGGKVDG